MSIYTGRGDEGETDLRGGGRVSKTSPRIEAYGTVDETNALVGTLRPTGYDDVDEILRSVQNHLHVIQADLANPGEGEPRIGADDVSQLEDWIDECDEELELLSSFVLPGGSDVGSRLHHARAVCRRSERRVVGLASEEAINESAVVYLNRLSDLLFTLARLVNRRDGVAEESPTY